MASKTRKISIALLILAEIALVVIWAVNGYEDTWFYAMLMLITISTSWTNFSTKSKDKHVS
ncbi:MAG: hypothetical protein V4665_03160 [Patescibacteria group bacterium]